MRRLAFAGLMFLAGCSGSSGPRMAELSDLPKSIPVRTLWDASVGEGGDGVFFPAVAAAAVFAAGQDGTVARFDAATGKESWRVNTGDVLSGGVGSDGNLVAIGTLEGEVVALEAASGKQRWRARLSSEILSVPLVTGDLVIARAADSRLFALDARDGKRRWSYQRSSPALTVRAPSGMIAERGVLSTGFAGGKLVSLALANGAVRWEATVALPRGATELERVTDVVGVPAIAEREVCAVAFQGRIGCFDLANGNPLWSRELSSAAGLAIDARYVMVSDDKGAVHALDRTNGRSVWKQDKLAHRRLSLPLPVDNEVAVGDLQGYVHFLSREGGSFVARIATDGSPVLAAPVRLPGGLLMQTRNGGLYALSLK